MTIQEAIRKIAVSGLELYCKVCKVDAVDEENRTIDCSPLDGSAPLLGVNLQANQKSAEGVVLFPAMGSYVVVAFINPSVGVVIVYEKIDKVRLKIGETSTLWTEDQVEIAVKDKTVTINSEKVNINGGKYGRLLKAEDFIPKINNLINAFNSHTHTTSEGPTTTPNLVSPVSTLEADKFLDKNVVH